MALRRYVNGAEENERLWQRLLAEKARLKSAATEQRDSETLGSRCSVPDDTEVR